MEQTQALLQIQDADLTILRVRTKLNSLPQKVAITENSKKYERLVKYKAQIEEIVTKYEEEIASLQKEDESLAGMLENNRATMDSTHDYRLIASLMRDTESSMKRRENIEFQLDKLTKQLDRANQLAADADVKLVRSEQLDSELVKSFRTAAANGQRQIDEAQRLRDEAARDLSPKILAEYDAIRKAKGGLGAGRLDGDHCSICRITFHEGQLARLLQGPSIAICPNCHRLIVVRD